ncbi:hypothetical protein BASA61_001027 [Batrachochytrium salamandrivorans]|nr:hypothetical protein BASA60_010019 [Batrachochytrium salamandrivorans]KAH6602570.1 hypothetical protein BASA61_001027 [Batrachochytrium salamandrivorans]
MFFITTIVLGLAVAAIGAPASINSVNQPSIPGYYSPPVVAEFSAPTTSFIGELDLPGLKSLALGHLNDTLALGDGVSILLSSSQAVNGIKIANSAASVAMDRHGNVISQTRAWVKVGPKDRAALASSLTAQLSPSQAFVSLTASLAETVDPATLSITRDTSDPNTFTITGAQWLSTEPITVQNKLYQTATGLRPVWEINLQLPISWINAYVDKETGKVIGSTDWSSSAMRTSDGRIIPQGLPGQKKRRPSNRRNRKKGNRSRQPAKTKNTARLPEPTTNTNTTRLPDPTTTSTSISATTTTSTSTTGQKTTAAGNFPPSSYRVIALGAKDPGVGGASLVSNPADRTTSPLGWHNANDGRGALSITKGNNVLARINSGASRNIPTAGLTTSSAFNFDFRFDDKNQQPVQYRDASTTNAFFLCNLYHDILFVYGFNEQAGNFQNSNLSGRGRDKDAILANIQDDSGTNNANFATPPDGRSGTMRMFQFTRSSPRRDASLDNGVILHELTHGLSNRLTGGPANSNCLQTAQSGGMGEGWSDVVAVVLEMLSSDTSTTPKVVGGYSTTNRRSGFRQFPYTTNLQVNPHTYTKLRTRSEVHAVGEVWASMLLEVYWNLVTKLGFTSNLKDNVKSGKGNSLFLQLVVDGMKLQPCNPTFVQARDAIIKADQTNNNGANFCEITRGFAKRGLGSQVRDNGQFINDFTLDRRCS